MSSRYSRGSRDIQRFRFHHRAQAWLEGFARNQVYPAAQYLLQVKLEIHVSVKRCLALKFHQEVYIAGRSGFIPDHRAKKRQRFDAELSKFLPVIG